MGPFSETAPLYLNVGPALASFGARHSDRSHAEWRKLRLRQAEYWARWLLLLVIPTGGLQPGVEEPAFLRLIATPADDTHAADVPNYEQPARAVLVLRRLAGAFDFRHIDRRPGGVGIIRGHRLRRFQRVRAKVFLVNHSILVYEEGHHT